MEPEYKETFLKEITDIPLNTSSEPCTINLLYLYLWLAEKLKFFPSFAIGDTVNVALKKFISGLYYDKEIGWARS